MLLLTFTIIAIAILGSWFFYSFILDHLPAALLRAMTSR
jgi:two-component system sensor histidine kinase AdeS